MSPFERFARNSDDRYFLISDSVYAVNAGGYHPVFASDGVMYQADFRRYDRFYDNVAIRATVDDALFQSEANSAPRLTYSTFTPPGSYLVTLHFAEIWSGALAEGARIADIAINGSTVFEDLDIFAAVGAHSALSLSFVVETRAHQLDVVLKGRNAPAKLSALKVETLRPLAEETASPVEPFEVEGMRVLWSGEAFLSVGETIAAVNAGASHDFTSADGTVFAADQFRGHDSYVISGPIAGTVDDALFRSEAWGENGLGYTFDVSDGVYMVELFFAEIYAPLFAEGRRVFDVYVEGALVEEGFDVMAEAGDARSAIIRSYVAQVSDGALDIDLEAVVQNPKLSAIKVSLLQASDVNAPPIAMPDVLVFDSDDIYLEVGSQVAEVSFDKWDLVDNDLDDGSDWDGFNDLQIEIVSRPQFGDLQLAGEASFITYFFNPAGHPGADSFTYRAFDEEGVFSNETTVDLIFPDLPTPAPNPLTLALADAATDAIIAPLTGAALIHAGAVSAAGYVLKAESAAGESVDFTVNGVATPGVPDGPGHFTSRQGDGDGVFAFAPDVFHRVSAAGNDGSEARSLIQVRDERLSNTSYLSPDVLIFDPAALGEATVPFFEELDTLRFVNTDLSASEIVGIAEIVGRDTVIDFGDGNVLTLVRYETLSADDILV